MDPKASVHTLADTFTANAVQKRPNLFKKYVGARQQLKRGMLKTVGRSATECAYLL